MTFRWKIAQAMEIRWWQKYLKNKDTTEYAAWKTQYWRNLLLEIGLLHEDNAAAGSKILDAGCGPAGIFMIFDKNQIVDALDPLIDEYEATLPHFKRAFYPNVRFLNQPLEDLNTKNTYDYIFCLNAINHVSNLDKAFDTLIDAAKSGGKLVVSIDAHNFPFLKKIFQALPGDILHPHQFDLKEYTHMLTQRGCTVEKTLLKKKEFIFNYYVLVATKN